MDEMTRNVISKTIQKQKWNEMRRIYEQSQKYGFEAAGEGRAESEGHVVVVPG